MPMTVDWPQGIISVPQSDLTWIAGTLYEMDTENYFRDSLMALADDEQGMAWPTPYRHNTEVTVAGTTYARTIEIINGYKVQFTPDAQWSVRLVGSNNNIFDIENGVLIQNQVQVIPTNSGGLIAADEMATRIAHLWQDRGFDASNPVTVNESNGTISVAGTIRTWAGSVIKTLTRTT